MVTRPRQASAASRATSSAVSSPSSSSFEDSSESDASGSEFSTDSEAQSVRRVRASRVSRRRWRKSQKPSASSTALLPPAEPASTSLWTTREKQFEKFRSSLLSMPVPDGVGRVEKAKGYSLHVMSVMNWVLPDSILHTSAIPASSGANESEEDEEEPLVTLGVHVSLFHATSKRFFGNTWVSPELAVDPFHIKQARHPKDGTLRYVIESALLKFRAYFISDIIDSNCVGVLELVAYEKDPDSKATIRVVGCGWTLLPLFARQQPVQSGVKDEPSSVPSAFSLNTSGDSVSVFTGSPRALWELNPDTWSAQEKHEGCKFYYQLVQYEPMMTIAMLLRKNELVGALDPIPGLRNGNLANIDMGKNPKMLLHEEADTTYEETLASFVKIASLVPKSVQVEEPFELNVVATRVAINLRDEIEANLVARLRISRKAMHEGAASVEGEVSARVLKLALHNGRCFRTRQFTVPLKADPNGGDTLLCVRNHSKLRGFVFHPNMAIVVVLQYTVHFRVIWPSKLKQQVLEAKKPPLPEEDVVLVTMGARALVPSDGKKLYLYDKHHHATAVSAEPLTTLGGVLLQEQEEHRRVLHVDLLSGAACRPYSDNTLYTPPDQVTRSLQNREPSAKDSFAFCDLKITIDEPPVEEETKAPASPVKPAVDECNQTNDDNDDCAADQWARKLLGKANSNPVLAQTLNALATSPTAKDKPADPPPRTPSPKKKQQVERPADPTTFVPDAPTSELSRASKTLLTRYGYMESHDKPPSSPTTNQKDHGKRKKPKKVELIAKSIETEVKDPLTANEIRFHFAAYRAYSPGVEMKTGVTYSSAPARVYLTFQFYNFPPTRTETLRLSKAFDNGAGGEIQTFLLMRDTTANKPSLAIQFDVDTTSTMNPLETRRFAEYLKWNNLYVDVWDADSLFQLGTFAIPLHELLRQGSSVKKFQAEVEIAPPLGGTLLPDHTGDDEGGAICTVPDTSSGASSPSIGRVQLLMSSYGLKGENYIDQQPSSQAGAVQPAAPNEGQEGQTRKPKHRVRARTLVESNPELYRLLAQEGFYGDRTGKELRERRESQPLQRKGPGAVNTLAPKEIAVLCELFGSRKTASGASSSAGNRPTRIKCDLERRTGLMALLSLKPSEAPAPVAAPVANPAEDKPVAVVESVEAPEVQVVDEIMNDIKADVHEIVEDIKADVHEVVEDIKADVREILRRLAKKGIKFEDVFLHFDADRNGTLSVEEFTQALHQLFQLGANSGDTLKVFERNAVEEYVKTINSDGDTKIDYCEFLVACGVSGKDMQEKNANFRHEALDKAERKLIKLIVRARASGMTVREVFDQFDSNSDGNISLAEFQFAMEKFFVGQGMAGDDAALVAARFDTNRDGMISRREFQEFGADLQKKFESLSSVFTPHLRSLCKLDTSSKLAGEKWESFCQEEVGLSSQSFRTGVMPLISYFGFVDEGGDIELSALVKIVQSANPSVKPPSKDAALARLRTLPVTASPPSTAVDATVTTTREEGQDNAVKAAEDTKPSPTLTQHEGSPDTTATTADAVDTPDPGDADKTPDTVVSAPQNASSAEEVKDSTENEVFQSEGGDESIPVATVLPDKDVKEPEAVKARQSPREEIDASGVEPGPADQTISAPSKEEGEPTHPESEGGDRGDTSSSEAAPVENKQHQLLVRSTSFGKGKDPESTGAPFRRTLTDSKAVGATEHEGFDNSKTTPLRVSFAAVRAAKRAEMATSEASKSEDGATANDSSLSEQVSDGLAKLKKLLLTAAGKGVAVQQSFNHFDKEAKGVLSYEQFVIGLRELGPDFANLSDDNILAMAKWLDGKQQNALRVEDFVLFVETPAVEEAPAVAENPVDSLKSEDETPAVEEVPAVADNSVDSRKSENCVLSVETPAVEEAPAVAENPVDSLKSEDQTSTTPSDPKSTPAAVSKRPPPLRRSGSSRIPAKKPPRPLTGTQSARAVTETAGSASTVVQDKPWKMKPTGAREAADKVEGMIQPAPAPERAEQVTKLEDGAGTPPQGSTIRDPQDQSGGAAHLDCNYTFSSNPEIRAVELKLRQTALDAYERGILPLRVVSKFLECANDRRGQVPGGRGRSSKMRSELLRVEFLQVLMELGFTLLSDQTEDEVDAGAGVKPVTKMNDHLYARQLERLARYRQHTKSDEAKAHKQLVRAVSKSKQHQQRGRQQGEDSLRRFEEEKKQLLRVLSYYRDGHKKSLVYSLLRQQVATSLTLFPSFGDLLFFELPFMNPYDHHDRFRIELLLPSSREIAVVLDLEIVRSSEEWAFYRANLPLAYGFASSSADIEDEMIDDHDEVVMDSHDQLHIPLRLRWLDTSDSFTRAQRPEPGKKMSPIPVSMVIKSCSHGHTVALFNLELQPQPFACHRVLRFSHPASSIWRWKLRYPRGKFVVCMDPSVAMESQRSGEDEANNSGLVSFKCRVGDYPALETFFVVLYDDKFYARVFEVWQVRIQSKLRVDVHAVLGQSVRHELVIKGDGGSSTREAEAARRRVMCFTPTQHRGLVQFRPAQVFALVPQAFNRIEFAFCAVESGAATQLVVLVNLVDVDTHELVGAWSVHVTLALPVITKTYELRLPVGRAAQKKISYSNPWDQPQTIVLRSSAPTLLVPREPVLQLPSNGQAFLRLAFAARDHSAAAAEDVYLFINDKRTDQNEECLLFQVTYE